MRAFISVLVLKCIFFLELTSLSSAIELTEMALYKFYIIIIIIIIITIIILILILIIIIIRRNRKQTAFTNIIHRQRMV